MDSLFLLGLLAGGVITAAIFIGTERTVERRKSPTFVIRASDKLSVRS